MARVTSTAVLGISGSSIDAMRASIGSLADALWAFEACPESFGDDFGSALRDLIAQAVDDPVDLGLGEVVNASALGADEIRLRCDPSDRYCELVAAVAANSGDRFGLDVRHGWPILSVGDRTPTVTEAGGVRNAPGGGSA